MSEATAPRRSGGRRLRRLLGALVFVAGLTLPAATVLPPAPADAGTACDGVSVRVERPGSVREGCAPGAPGTGLQALEKAGFSYTFVDGQPGMVCTIGGYPDPCNGAPADAYWAYYHADAGATSWTYSSRGAGNRNPPAGGHEAWVFGAGARPSAPPPSTAPEPAPSPSPSAPASPSPAPPKDGGGSGGGSGSGATDGAGSTGGSGSSGGSSTGGATSEDAPRAGANSTASGGDAPPSTADGDDVAEDEDTTANGTSDEDAPAGGPDDAVDDTDEVDGQQPEDADGAEDDDTTVRPEALDDTVTVDAPSGGRTGLGAAAGALLVVGLGAAGLLRSRGRRGDLDGEA